MNRRPRVRRGFTLWETALVLAVLAVTLLLAAPAIGDFGAQKQPTDADALLALLRDSRREAVHINALVALRMDPTARSSMWEDLQAGRRTEVDYLNGAVVALAEKAGLDAPANRRIVALVHDAEQGRAAGMKGKELLAALHVQAAPASATRQRPQ